MEFTTLDDEILGPFDGLFRRFRRNCPILVSVEFTRQVNLPIRSVQILRYIPKDVFFLREEVLIYDAPSLPRKDNRFDQELRNIWTGRYEWASVAEPRCPVYAVVDYRGSASRALRFDYSTLRMRP